MWGAGCTEREQLPQCSGCCETSDILGSTHLLLCVLLGSLMSVQFSAILSVIGKGVLSLGEALDPNSSLEAISDAAKPLAPRVAQARRKRQSSSMKLVKLTMSKRA